MCKHGFDNIKSLSFAQQNARANMFGLQRHYRLPTLPTRHRADHCHPERCAIHTHVIGGVVVARSGWPIDGSHTVPAVKVGA